MLLPDMSALGQKACAAKGQVCLTRKWTCALHQLMSAVGQKADIALFDQRGSSSIFQSCLGYDEIRCVKALAKRSVRLAEL